MDITQINVEELSQEQIDQLIALRAQTDWRSKLAKDKFGEYIISPENYLIYFDCSPETKGKLKKNSLSQLDMFDGHPMTQGERDTIYIKTISFFGNKSNKGWFDSALSNYFEDHQYNPLQDYLENLPQWDGIPRMETVFIDWLGAEDTPLNREMTRKWFLAAVKRVLKQGCQFDNIIILQCPEGGGGKTTLIKRLGLYDENNEDNFYVELYGNDIADEKVIAEKLKEAWIVAFDELEGLSKRDVNNIKTFLSKTEERVRLAYARQPAVLKRHCVFIGSTNDSGFLKDYSGSIERRFWVIPITRKAEDNIVYTGFTKDIVDQIWAEAYLEYHNNQSVSLDISRDNYEALGEVQSGFKSFNNDIEIEYFKEIMERKFILNDKKEFASEQDFLNQMEGVNGETGFETKDYIIRIPAAWVRTWAGKKYEWKGTKYIAAGMGCVYKPAYYLGKTQNCFVRKNAPDGRKVNFSTFDVSTLLPNEQNEPEINITGKDLFS